MTENVNRLDHSTVCGLVPEKMSGFYRLGNLEGSKFCVGYVGRSDYDLRARLRQHADTGKFCFFDFKVTDKYEAFLLECREWHILNTASDDVLTNINHPAAPKGKPFICPYCFRVDVVRKYFLKGVVGAQNE